MKNILFINLPKSFETELKLHIESYGYNFNHTPFNELSLLNGQILFEQQEIKHFDYVLIGLAEKYKYISPIVKQYLLNKNIPFIFYGHKPNHIDSKSFEIYNLSNNNIPIIPSLISRDRDTISYFINKYHQPFITKPINGKKGREIVRHSSLDSILDAIEKSEIPLIIQPMIPNDGDYRVWILKNKVIGVIKRTPSTEDEFRSNISLGGNAQVAKLPDDILELAVKSTQVLDLDIAGVDIIQDINTGKYYIMEVNSAPQLTGFMATTGIDLFEVITKYIVQEIESNIKTIENI
jgi:RimK family alpha-L-glutamate ligase